MLFNDNARRRQGGISLLCLLLVLVLLLSVQPLLQLMVHAMTTSVSLGKAVTGEGDDFATRVLGMPWNMQSAPYPDFPTVFGNVDRNSLSVANGVWNFTTTSNDPSIWLLPAGIANTQQVLKLGDRYPIDPAKYSLLSFRLCSNVSDVANILWFLDQAPHANFVESNFITINPGCGVYVINLNQIGAAATHGTARGWSGTIRGLRLDPLSINSGVNLSLDWVRLTTVDTANYVPLNWSNVTSGQNLNFYLSAGTTCDPSNATLILSVPRTASSGSVNWGAFFQTPNGPAQPLPLPESFEPGQYSVSMRVDGGAANCAGALEIRRAPILTFQKPSMFSGPDYATETLNDPWGMSNSQDIAQLGNFNSATFSDGIFTGITNASGDPNILLRLGTPINATKYKYATFRMYLEGNQDIGLGSVQRFFWWYQGPTVDAVTTKDMIVYEGWQTYTLDLTKALIENGFNGRWAGFPTAFRLDPDEFPQSRVVHLDYVTLTGDETVQAGTSFPIIYTLSNANATVTFYYDTDKNAGNGRTLIGQSQQQPLRYTTYLPSVLKSSNSGGGAPELNLFTGNRFVWNTQNVPNGSYYISADVSDGVNITTWYSDLPVTVYR